MKEKIAHYWGSFSFIGLVFATLFFAASVTPSLLPRPYLVQGILSGFSIAIGYAIGICLLALWRFLELREPSPELAWWGRRISSFCSIVVLLFFMRQANQWQNSIRSLMEMPQTESAYPIRFFLIAIVVASLLIAAFRFLIRCGIWLGRKLDRFMPRRIAYTVSGCVVTMATVFILNGVVARAALNVADGFFLRADELIEEGIEAPPQSLACGSEDSLVAWDSIGRQGKRFLTEGPSIDAMTHDFESIDRVEPKLGDEPNDPILRPLRVYVGKRSRETPRDRAVLALEELIRVGGFDRSVLIIATPTGTGWLDENAVDTIEYLHRGDTAIVSTQYSYLPSWMTILVDPQRSKRSAQALFDAIYNHWRTLPEDDRPKLYLQGLSLGSLGSETSADLLTVFEDPIQGALWSGPPFPSRQWSEISQARNEGSPIWMPTFRDQSMIRFTSQQNQLDGDQRWGPIRNVYLQYASDPMIWFSPELFLHRPAWLGESRGPDVSPHLRWYPLVTGLQIAFDLPLAESVPRGYGHNYAPEHYIDGWIAVTNPDPDYWTRKRIEKLKSIFVEKRKETDDDQ